ncbi:MAG: hypothetical protein BZ136_04090 [Methanosphaera sp. rholeuAM74]|nr:MAG: hypothetical protein BZ136_04090 [Methanosphaera sp. rholeuAM74]
MFYLDSSEEYYETYLDFSNLFPFKKNELLSIYTLFKELKIHMTQPIQIYWGIFLEVLTNEFLKLVFDEKDIKREIEIIIDNFKTNPIDFVVKVNNTYKCYECKFSSNTLKKNQTNHLLWLKNKTKNIIPHLVIFEPKQDIIHKIENNTGLKHLVNEKNLGKIRYITIEDFSRNNPFKNS